MRSLQHHITSNIDNIKNGFQSMRCMSHHICGKLYNIVAVIYLRYFFPWTFLIVNHMSFDEFFDSDAGDGTIFYNISTSRTFGWIQMVRNVEPLLPDLVHDLGVELTLNVRV